MKWTSFKWASLTAIMLVALPSCSAYGQNASQIHLHPDPNTARAPKFVSPVGCKVGSSCFIVSYPDHDPTHGWHDFSCGHLTYDGNTGLEIGLVTLAQMRSGVPVVAAADGIVKSVRTSMPDSGRKRQLPEDLEGREAGNGVQIDHGDGWSSLYAHLMQFSITVEPGQRVAQGQRLGFIGLSGASDYPHLYFRVSYNGQPVDPYIAFPATCSDGQGPPRITASKEARITLWTNQTTRALGYRETQLIGYGLVDKLTTVEELRQSQTSLTTTSLDAEALSLYADFLGLQTGDSFQLRLMSPYGDLAAERTWHFSKPRLRHTGLISKDRPAQGWRPGTWFGEIFVWRTAEDETKEQIFTRRFEIKVQ